MTLTGRGGMINTYGIISALQEELQCPELKGSLLSTNLTALIKRAIHKLQALQRTDNEAAEYVESVIARRTHFTGEPPYVGWKGLGLALNEALDELEKLRVGVKPILVNLPFDRVPQHATDPGFGPVPPEPDYCPHGVRKEFRGNCASCNTPEKIP